MKIDAKTLLAFVRVYSGHTVDPATGDVPSSGYVVAVNSPEVRLERGDLDDHGEQAAAWVLNQAHQLDRLAFVWTDETTGEIVFAMAENYQTLVVAMKVAAALGEKTIFDVKNLTELAVTDSQE